MSGYTEQTWADGPSGGTPINAARLQHMEDGIVADQPDVAMPPRDRAALAKTLRAARRGINVSGREWSTGAPWENPGSWPFLYSRGHRLIRLPFLWESIQPTLGGALDPTTLAGLHATVAAIGAAGLKVVLDVHNYARYNNVAYGTAGSFTQENFVDLWTRLSTEFCGDPVVVGYGLCNEPHDLTGGATAWQAVEQAAVTAIRGNDDPTCIMVGGYGYSTLGGWLSSGNAQTQPWITDPINNIRYEAHHYWSSSGGGGYPNSYSTEQTNSANAGWGGTDPLATRVLAELKAWIGWLKASGQRGFIGEFAWPSTASTDAGNAASWDALAAQWLTRIDAEGDLIWATAWATGDRWPAGYMVNYYTPDANGVLSTPLSNAATLEAHAEHGAIGQGHGIVEGPSLPAFSFPTGSTIFPVGANATGTSSTLGIGSVRLLPFYLPAAMKVTGLGVEVTVAGDSGGKVRLGLYADNGAGQPGALIVDAGTVAGDVVAAIAEATLGAPVTLGPGWYWQAVAVQNVTTTQPTLRTIGSVGAPGFLFAATYSGAPTAGATAVAYQQTGATGALPATISSNPATGGTAARMMLRAG